MNRDHRASHVVFTKQLTVELLDRELGKPKSGELLIKTTSSLISTGTELTVLRGNHTPGSVWHQLFGYPWDAGYCNVGIVMETGASVQGFKPGDRVASTGPHATRFTIFAKDCVLVPEGVEDDEAVFATIAQIVMQGVRQSDITLGENAVVVGLGLLGQMTIALSRHLGAWPVIAIDPESYRRDMARAMGATFVTAPEDAAELVGNTTEKRMADIVFEVTGSPGVIPAALSLTRVLGRFVMISSPTGPTTIDFHDLVNARGTTIIGAHNYTHASVPNEYNRWTRNADTAYYLLLVKDKLISVQKMISHRFHWKEAANAYQQLLHDRAATLGVILDWNN